MTAPNLPHPHQNHPLHDVPDSLVPGSLPVEPDQGPVPPVIPEDPEHDRVIDPEI